MPCWKDYHTPETVEDAVALLARYDGAARVVGGGTDLLLEIQQGHKPRVEALVDPTGIVGLDAIVEEGGYLVLGCGVSHTKIVSEPRIIRGGTCLVESCGVIGGPQVRNVATLAGNIAHALPAGDGTIGLLALEGDIEVASVDGSRWMPMAESFLGPGQSVVDPTREIISRMRFKPTGSGEGSAFRRIMRPQGVALPILSMAARIGLQGEKVESARITIGPAGPTPFLAEKAMAYLRGKEPNNDALAGAAEVALEEVNLRTSLHRATSEYRGFMIRSELPRTLAKAVERARTGEAIPEGVGE